MGWPVKEAGRAVLEAPGGYKSLLLTSHNLRDPVLSVAIGGSNMTKSVELLGWVDMMVSSALEHHPHNNSSNQASLVKVVSQPTAGACQGSW